MTNIFPFDVYEPSISKMGNKIYYSSDTDGIANGPKDLFFSTGGDTFWSAPIYLGNLINSPNHIERSPCIGYDDTTLYFTRGYPESIYVSYYR